MFWNTDTKRNSYGVESKAIITDTYPNSNNGLRLQKKIEKAFSAQFIFENFGSVAIGLSELIELSSENLFFDVPVLIAGKYNGLIHSTSDLIFTETAVINGKISAKNVYNFGSINGIASIKGNFQNLVKGSFKGSLECANAFIEPTSVFNATCKLGALDNNIQDNNIQSKKLEFSDFFSEQVNNKSKSSSTQLSLAS
jgi:cytoskeletal protein CcmA (bactofilin family)